MFWSALWIVGALVMLNIIIEAIQERR